jgi:fermentation-respiration switch protein FrsA (DUF1100 family)
VRAAKSIALTLRSAGRFAAGATLAGCIAACTSVFYQPSGGMLFPLEMVRAPQPAELKIPTPDGGHLYSWHFRSQRKEPTKGLVVLFHGNGGNISSHYLGLLWILDQGWDFMIFDYRGYGGSPFGSPKTDITPESTLEDGIMALKWAVERKRTEGGKLVIMGQSLGGAIAPLSILDSGLKKEIDLLVIDGSFDSYQEAGRKALSRFWITWPLQWLSYLIVSDRKAPEDRLKELSPLPVLVMHGTQDATVAYSLGERVYKHLDDPKEFWSIPGAGHMDAFWAQDGLYRRRFLDRINAL